MIKITEQAYTEIVALAKNGIPYEICGYGVGRNDVITKIIPMSNVSETPEVYFNFNREEMFRVQKECRQMGLKLLMVYHSHPKGGEGPSESDKQYLADPSLSYIIVSLSREEPQVNGYWIKNKEAGALQINIIKEQRMHFYELPSTLFGEQDQFEKDIERFVKGELEHVKFRAIRVSHGVYEQRKDNTFMVRVRCPAGSITPAQFRKVSDLAHTFGSGECHVTTRQEIQMHYVRIENLMKVIRSLNEVNLTTRGGGSNTIRNIVTTPDSGIDPNEVFDVDPYATELTTRMIAESDSYTLPRKFKINFSNSREDKALTAVTCLGFVAEIRNGQKGFYVVCSGGMGAKPMVGHTLFDWVPDTQVYHITRAMKTIYDKNGNRRSRNTNRIKFLWNKLGEEGFKELFFAEYNKIKDDQSLALVLKPVVNEAKTTQLKIELVDTPEFHLWKKRFTFEQKQKGLFSIKVPLKLGDIEHEDVYRLSNFVENFGENTIRFTNAQNIQLRNIPGNYLGNAYLVIKANDTLSDRPAFIGNMTNCTGASTCKLGIGLPRGLNSAIAERLKNSKLNLDELANFKLNMSGCPNTCGMHHVADLGFYGKIGRKNGKLYPAYVVLAGAEIGVESTKYAEKISEINSKHIPNFVYDFLEHYLSKKKEYSSYINYLEKEGKAKIVELCEKYKEIPTFEEDPSWYIDFGAIKPLSMDEIGTAECSAGMFDMIDVDMKTVQSYQKKLTRATTVEETQDLLYHIIFSSSRMLLVTRGLDARSDEDIFTLFQKHFIDSGLVGNIHSSVVSLGKAQALAELPKHVDAINALGNEVIELYKGMDDSLRFKSQQQQSSSVSGKEINKQPEQFDKFVDLRGVACPMNFVKTKMALSPMKKGEKLQVFLDNGEPIQNVPNSIKLEGHKILEKKQLPEQYWNVLIEKV